MERFCYCNSQSLLIARACMHECVRECMRACVCLPRPGNVTLNMQLPLTKGNCWRGCSYELLVGSTSDGRGVECLSPERDQGTPHNINYMLSNLELPPLYSLASISFLLREELGFPLIRLPDSSAATFELISKNTLQVIIYHFQLLCGIRGRSGQPVIHFSLSNE